MLRAVRFPVSITALDLSSTSIEAARKSVKGSRGRKRDVTFAKPICCLCLSRIVLDLVVTSGALEYVPLADGLSELARSLRPAVICFICLVGQRSPVKFLRFYSDSKVTHRAQ